MAACKVYVLLKHILIVLLYAASLCLDVITWNVKAGRETY